MYGWRTILSGTIMPPRAIALAFPQILRDLIRTGFELGVHGYDHVRWQDQLDQLGENGVSTEIDDAFEVYHAVCGVQAHSFAAPGWRINAAALRMLDGNALSYQSNTRGHIPYRCAVDGAILSAPEIPTTLPTMDEVMGSDNLNGPAEIVSFYLGQFSENELNVLTIHAETEGMSQIDTFAALARGLRERGTRFVQLHEVAQRLSQAELPVCELIRSSLPGRAGWVSAQGPIAPSPERA
jgi:peptidoglycan/xylan/chitin deacetylase (PgdA/CDA1 family)